MYYKIKKMLIDMLKFNLITATQRKFRLSYRSQYKKEQAQPTIYRRNDALLPPTLPPKAPLSVQLANTPTTRSDFLSIISPIFVFLYSLSPHPDAPTYQLIPQQL